MVIIFIYFFFLKFTLLYFIEITEILSPKSVKTLELTRGNLLGIYMEDMENDGRNK